MNNEFNFQEPFDGRIYNDRHIRIRENMGNKEIGAIYINPGSETEEEVIFQIEENGTQNTYFGILLTEDLVLIGEPIKSTEKLIFDFKRGRISTLDGMNSWLITADGFINALEK